MPREAALLLAVAALAAGATLNFGLLAPFPLLLAASSVVLMAVAYRSRDAAPASDRFWLVIVGAVAAVNLTYGHLQGYGFEALLATLVVAGTVAIILLRRRAQWKLAMVASGVAVIAMTVALWTWGYVNIDVFRSLQNASAALLAGHNPYSPTFTTPVMTGPSSWSSMDIHFQYLPGAVLLGVPGRVLGDVRVMAVVAAAVAVALCARLAVESPGQRERAIKVAALAIATPMTVAILHLGWVDVFSVAAFAGWVALRRDHRRWAVLCLAVALTVKPTILVAVVPMTLWSRRARVEVAIAAGTAAVVILPFVLMTGAGAFYQDVIGIQTSLGFRYDALTLPAAWYALTGWLLPNWVEPLIGAAFAVAVLRRRPRDLSDVLIAAALLMTGAFLLSKWAFLNYYYVPVWLLLLAAAGRGIAFEARTEDIALPRVVLARARGWRWSPA